MQLVILAKIGGAFGTAYRNDITIDNINIEANLKGMGTLFVAGFISLVLFSINVSVLFMKL